MPHPPPERANRNPALCTVLANRAWWGGRVPGPRGQGRRRPEPRTMGRPSLPLLLGLVGASLAQAEAPRGRPIFPLLPPITCYYTEMLYLGRRLSLEPEVWSSGLLHSQLCENWEVCQETLLLLQTGPHSLIMGSKGCTPAGNRISGVTEHSGPPGIIITSYIRFCNVNYCNNSSSTAPVLRPKPHLVPARVMPLPFLQS
ncbi:CD177 antigen-like isoform X3 [Macrotis lagotis]|uniref:CD177 antigen-like isoform X3 n=1 Tax=Macrotis lagotis TaxID=92651 RepID=UPI003D693CAD